MSAKSTPASGELKRNISRMDLISIAAGMIIGAGIMAMTGTAIGMTGRSVNIAFMIAGVLSVITAIPMILVGGTARFRGGQYTQIAAFGGQKMAGIFILINFFMCLGIAMYILSFTDYLLALVPGAPSMLVSVTVLTILFAINILGGKQAAVLQTIMCAIMAVAIALFIAFGVTNVQPGYFEQPGFMTNGITGILIASAYLSFAAGGAAQVVNYSGEAKNPTKDIPFAIIVTTVGISIIYAIMGTIAAGVLPVEQVANKSLALVAEVILPRPLYVFFIVGAAMFALLTTLNASIGWMCRPFVQAANDGWLPKIFGRLHPKFGTPVAVLIAMYIIGVVPVLMNLDISVVSSATAILSSISKTMLCFTALSLPKVMPELWNKSKFHVSNRMLKFLCILGGGVGVFQVLMLIATSGMLVFVFNVVMLAASVAYTFVVNKRVKMEVSYEDCN